MLRISLPRAVDERGYAALRIRDVVKSPEDLETDDFEVNEGSVFDERRKSWYVPNYPLVNNPHYTVLIFSFWHSN